MNARQKLEAEEQKEALLAAADYQCLHCHGPVRAHGTPQLAHRIAKSKANYSRWGAAIIDHPYNLAPVCQVEPCNSAMNIGGNPEKCRLLQRLVLGAIVEGKNVLDPIEVSHYLEEVF